jgi:hypothetical protein
MAVKKSKPAETAAKTATAKKSAPKPKKAPATKATPVAAEPVAKVEAPKKAVAAKKASAAAKKVAAPVKLTDNQVKFLKQIHETKEGFLTAKKAELKTLETLLDKKLIKKGAKDKASGNFRYTVSKAGEKHLSSLPPA